MKIFEDELGGGTIVWPAWSPDLTPLDSSSKMQKTNKLWTKSTRIILSAYLNCFLSRIEKQSSENILEHSFIKGEHPCFILICIFKPSYVNTSGKKLNNWNHARALSLKYLRPRLPPAQHDSTVFRNGRTNDSCTERGGWVVGSVGRADKGFLRIGAPKNSETWCWMI